MPPFKMSCLLLPTTQVAFPFKLLSRQAVVSNQLRSSGGALTDENPIPMGTICHTIVLMVFSWNLSMAKVDKTAKFY